MSQSGSEVRTRQAAKTFKDLIVWQKAHQFVIMIYTLSARFPNQELYGLTSQLRRAVVSVPANIAEGFKKRGKADKLRYLNIAQASLEECRYYLILAKDLHYGESGEAESRMEETGRLLDAYAATIRDSEF